MVRVGVWELGYRALGYNGPEPADTGRGSRQ